MADNAGSDPSDDESDTSRSSGIFLYMGEGSVPNVRRAEVHHSVEFIPDRLFEECDQLESVLLHEGLLGIGNWAFLSCYSLRELRCPSTVTDIGEGAFSDCPDLAIVELPEGIESIKGGTFRECTSLEKMRIPAMVTWIGDCAFADCTNLASLDLREGLRTIGNWTFMGCQSLESLFMPSSVDEIGEEAFYGCSSLTLVQLREDLQKIKQFAFRGCPPESFQFDSLPAHIEAMHIDDQTKSMFESRLNEMTLALTRADRDVELAYDSDGELEDDPGALWERCKESLGRAHGVLTYLELKGAAPVLELALWKAKIEGERKEGAHRELIDSEEGGLEPSDLGRERKRPKVTKNIDQDTRLSREDCCVKCGADIVFPEVLRFFTYSSSWPRLDDLEEGNVEVLILQ